MISVIIPNYNNAHYVGDAIRSVLAQNYQEMEIIVVDDGSTDNSRAVIGEFGDRVRYLWQENQGLAGARNTGIRAAQSEFIGLLDADDAWQPAYLTTISKLIDQYPTAAVYYSAAQCMDAEGKEVPRRLGESKEASGAIYQTLLRANFLIPSTIVLRTSVVQAAGLFDQKLRSCEDWDLWLRIAPQQQFVGVAEPLVRYRLHGSSLSANLTGMHRAAQAVIEKNFGPDDGQPNTWLWAKRRAYGGLYRYFLLTTVQRQNHWEVGAGYLRQALLADPSLAVDLNLFYELAFGAQTISYRGTSHDLALAENARQLQQLIAAVFAQEPLTSQKRLYHQTTGTAHFALGLAAYNVGDYAFSRRYFPAALRHRPELWCEVRVAGNLIKSLAGRQPRRWLRSLVASKF